MKTVKFLTGNQGKWKIARDIFVGYQVDLLQEKFDTPEIQSLDVEEVAKFSVMYASRQLGNGLMKSDVGYYIPALNNFPGPFIKFINQTLQPEDILALMHKKEDRSVILRECLAYMGEDGKTVGFISEQKATIAVNPEGTGSTIDRLLILDGFDRPKGACDPDDIFAHWKKTLGVYHDVAKYASGQPGVSPATHFSMI